VISQCFNGVPPTTSNFNEYSRVKAVTIIKRFGSWKNAITRSGFEYSQGRINKNDLINDLKRVLEENNNEYFTIEFYEMYGSYSPKSVKKSLGYSKWQELLATELSIRKYYKVLEPKTKRQATSKPSRSELTNDLKKVWETLGRRPSWNEYKKHGCISTARFESEFGTWTNAIEYCCEKHNFKIQGSSSLNSTPQILLTELKAIANKAKSSSLEYKKYKELGGSFSIGTFQNTFGSWKEACKKAGVRSARSLDYSDDELFDEIQRLWELYGREPKAREVKTQSSISFNAFIKRFGSHSKIIHTFCIDREKPVSPDTPQEPLTIIKEENTNIQSKEQPNNDNQGIKMTTPRFPSKRLRFIILNRDKFMCVKCGHGPQNNPATKLHIDHIIPYSKGGETTEENLQALCSACNLGKSDLIL